MPLRLYQHGASRPFFLPLLYQPYPLRARSLLQAGTPPGDSHRSKDGPCVGFGSHSPENLLIGALYLKKLPADGRLPSHRSLSGSLRAVGLSCCRRVGVPRSLPKHTYLSISFGYFSTDFSTILKLIDYRHFKNRIFSTKSPLSKEGAEYSAGLSFLLFFLHGGILMDQRQFVECFQGHPLLPVRSLFSPWPFPS